MEPELILAALLLGLALATGGAVGWWAVRLGLRRLGRASTPRPVADQAAPAPLAPGIELAGRGQVWELPSAPWQRALIRHLALHSAAGVPVLVVPAPGQRDLLAQQLAGLAAVCWPPLDQPPSKLLLEATATLRHTLPPLVLVQGLEALQQAEPEEPHDAPLLELLAMRPAELGLLVLCTPDQPLSHTPELRLEADGAALVGPAGAPRIVFDGSLPPPLTAGDEATDPPC